LNQPWITGKSIDSERNHKGTVAEWLIALEDQVVQKCERIEDTLENAISWGGRKQLKGGK
jgi:hypothetical protein